MHLKVNGQSIPLHGKFELDLFLDKHGEQFPADAVIRIHGGVLKIHGRSESPGLLIVTEQSIECFARNDHPGISIKRYNGTTEDCEIEIRDQWLG